jgi:RNA-directed DNA polymerase
MSEPKDKLDATRSQTAATAADRAALVNGPEDAPPVWRAVDWRQAERDVRRLRQRIFAASQAGDLARVRNLQKLMLRSRANALISVRRVTELNAGRRTAGVDGQLVLGEKDKADLAVFTQRGGPSWKALPVRRVFISQRSGKLRALGVPVIADRSLQARALSALEPEWEARFEPKSYGFRPGRCCQDAIAAIFWTVAGKRTKRRWALDADLASAFDRVRHDHILAQLGTFPAREAVADWLRAGVCDQGRYAPTEQGTPQGGVISPLIFNIALHGMETAAGAAYRWNPHRKTMEAVSGTPVLIRYADDAVALCDSREQAEQVKARLSPWLAARGLAFNEDKTRVVCLDEGLDYLGFNVRRYGGKLLIKPSKQAVRRVRGRLSTEMRSLRGANAAAVLRRINPIVRGWSAYYSGAVATETFRELDAHVWRLTYKWACFRHPKKPKRWIISRYFGPFHPTRRDRWVFGSRDSGAYLHRFAWTKIIRHDLVKGTASPDDPALTGYWASRRRKRGSEPPVDRADQRLLKRQRGRCAICDGLLLHADRRPQSPTEWEQWLRVTQQAIRRQAIAAVGPGPNGDQERLVHTHCRRHPTAGRPATLHACELPGLA